jgi:hypothetical protein
MKDLFSINANEYSAFRPIYPTAFYDFILKQCRNKFCAWDCGTGNGQVAFELSKHFQKVYATDISHNQIEQAFKQERITYKVESVEKCSFADDSFDFIIAAQSAHWFDLNQFYEQVYRTAASNCIIVLAGYSLIQVDQNEDVIISELYSDILGSYWDPERKYIDDQYRSISFPFTEINAPEFYIELNWSLTHLLGYLKTWSAAGNYEKLHHVNPIDLIAKNLKDTWGDAPIKKIRFPVFMRLGLVEKQQ